MIRAEKMVNIYYFSIYNQERARDVNQFLVIDTKQRKNDNSVPNLKNINT